MICPICQDRFAPFPTDDFECKKDKFVPIKEGALERRRRMFFSNQENGGCTSECKGVLRFMLSAYNSSIKRNQ